MSELRAYAYKCRRCGEIEEETDLADNAKDIETSVHDYTLQKSSQRLLSNELLRHCTTMSYHNCEDGGIGISDIAGCSEPYVPDGE